MPHPIIVPTTSYVLPSHNIKRHVHTASGVVKTLAIKIQKCADNAFEYAVYCLSFTSSAGAIGLVGLFSFPCLLSKASLYIATWTALLIVGSAALAAMSTGLSLLSIGAERSAKYVEQLTITDL